MSINGRKPCWFFSVEMDKGNEDHTIHIRTPGSLCKIHTSVAFSFQTMIVVEYVRYFVYVSHVVKVLSST